MTACCCRGSSGDCGASPQLWSLPIFVHLKGGTDHHDDCNDEDDHDDFLHNLYHHHNDVHPGHPNEQVDTMSFGSSAQKGCYCALSTAASHGQRKVFHLLCFQIWFSCQKYFRKALHKLVTHPTTLTSQNSGREVMVMLRIMVLGDNSVGDYGFGDPVGKNKILVVGMVTI